MHPGVTEARQARGCDAIQVPIVYGSVVIAFSDPQFDELVLDLNQRVRHAMTEAAAEGQTRAEKEQKKREAESKEINDETRIDLLFRIARVLAPYCYRCPLGLQPSTCRNDCLGDLERLLQDEGQQVAGVGVEPMLPGLDEARAASAGLWRAAYDAAYRAAQAHAQARADAFRAALEKVRGDLGREYSIIINGERITLESKFNSYNPANKTLLPLSP